jgi:flagellar hook-basal body complex protein FliE
MAAPILPAHLTIPAIADPASLLQGPLQSPAAAGTFQSAFSEAVSKVESFQSNVAKSVDRLLSGEGEELHHVAIAAQQADLSFQLFMQVRNKVVNAYQQMMQMQI